MINWRPSSEYRKVAEANREFYARSAELYDSTETCVTDRAAQSNLQLTLDRVIQECGKPAGEIVALDACGGSGNISLKLLERQVQVVLADISPELQKIFLKRCETAGFRARTVCGEIAEFLATTDLYFDLIVFSSALHHLQNIEEVLRLAFSRLQPNGLLFTTFDPTSRDKLSGLARFLTRAEYYLFKVFCQPTDVPKAMIRRLTRMASGATAANKNNLDINESTAGMLAEYHVEKGINDLALVQRLREIGYDIVWHDRFSSARFGPTRMLLRKLGGVTSFQLLLRRPRRAV